MAVSGGPAVAITDVGVAEGAGSAGGVARAAGPQPAVSARVTTSARPAARRRTARIQGCRPGRHGGLCAQPPSRGAARAGSPRREPRRARFRAAIVRREPPRRRDSYPHRIRRGSRFSTTSALTRSAWTRRIHPSFLAGDYGRVGGSASTVGSSPLNAASDGGVPCAGTGLAGS